MILGRAIREPIGFKEKYARVRTPLPGWSKLREETWPASDCFPPILLYNPFCRSKTSVVLSFLPSLRRYAGARDSMLKVLQSHTRRVLAKRRGNRLAREKRSVIAVQCAYRSRKARLAAAYKRVIRFVCFQLRK